MTEPIDVRPTRQAAYLGALAEQPDGVTRRRFLELIGASLALSGVVACAPPRDKIVPYVREPEQEQANKPLFFASAHVQSGFANGILVESNFGRPTKIEGNPQHPASLGATDAFGQASVLTLYEPSRAQTVSFNGQINTWAEFQRRIRATVAGLAASGGQGIRFLAGSSTSPTLAAQIAQLGQLYPAAQWHWWEPVNRDAAMSGAQLAFGQPVETRYHFDAADVILTLDSDVLAWDPGRLRYMHDFASRRRPENAALSRVYAVESTPSLLGAVADHRLPLGAGAIEPFAFALASALGVDVGAAQTPATEVDQAWLTNLVNDLRAHGRTSLVIPGEFQSPNVHALAHSINAALGSVGTTLDYSNPVALDAVDHVSSLRSLVSDMQAGRVALLVILGGNPVYSAPADILFAEALAQVGTTVHLGLFANETSARCQWQIPELHALEMWSDARAFDGTATIVQPLIAPLYGEAHSVHEVLASFTDQPGSSSHDIVRGFWETQQTGVDFSTFWRRTLSDGIVANSVAPPVNVSPRPDWAANTSVTAPTGALELVIRPDPALYDGEYATNGWLLELPRPLTKITWDNAALLSPATARQLNVNADDVVEVRSNAGTVRAPVWIQPGQADNSITLTLGYGRTQGASAGNNVGFRVPRVSTELWTVANAQATKTGDRYHLVSTQGNWSMQGHELVVTVSPDQLQVTGHQPPDESMYPAYPYPDNRWGMV
ncbi:MAG: molybdopterin oxidoreductase, partial [Chloroflexi bacterium]|nr:molybdopterin oxidoreductase [Chloroflexota bacterium]